MDLEGSKRTRTMLCRLRKKKTYVVCLALLTFVCGWGLHVKITSSITQDTNSERDVYQLGAKLGRSIHQLSKENVHQTITNSERNLHHLSKENFHQITTKPGTDYGHGLKEKELGGHRNPTKHGRNVHKFAKENQYGVPHLATEKDNHTIHVRPSAIRSSETLHKSPAKDERKDFHKPTSKTSHDNIPSAPHNRHFSRPSERRNSKQQRVRQMNDSSKETIVVRPATRNQRLGSGILIVGAGLSGAVLAHLHATVLNQRVLVIEKRSHVGGNCYDFINEHGIRVSKYGAHLFHTSNKLVWRYLSQFSEWIPYEHRVVARVDDTYVPVPVNIDTVNSLFNLTIRNQTEMSQWLQIHQVHNDRPQNGEEAAKARVGEILFDKLFKHYTYKQWEKFPKDLDASVLQRIPVRDNFDDRYFPDDVYQALPSDGYTAMISRMLNHSLITVKVNSDFFQLQKNKKISVGNFSKVFFTGPIDSYFASSGLDKLEYRSINFETIHLDRPIYQPNVVVNYPQGPEEFTRIIEYKHLYNQIANGTTIVREYSSATGDPYYPVPNERNRKLYSKYAELAKEEEKKNNVYFVGRLASYKYFNMDQAVLNAINEFYRVYKMFSIPEAKFLTKSLPEAEEIFKKEESKSSISIITSHCKENLNWISEGFVHLCNKTRVNIFIYEKCHHDAQGSEIAERYPECNILQTELPNVGREGHTWLYHMMMKQTSFSDINVFVQGGKEVSTERVLRTINQMESLKKFKSINSKYSPPEDLHDHYVPFGQTHCFDLVSHNFGWMYYQIEQKVCSYYHAITGTSDRCVEFVCTYRGEFVVTDVLLRRKLAIYRKLMVTWFADLSSANDPAEGHLLERLWTLFFRFPVNPEC